MSYGIAISKDVMVEMRDGILLATDVYRPARDGDLVDGSFPTIVCLTPYDKTERRYTEIADFFVPHGYAVVLQDLRDRHRSQGTKEYFHSATPHTGEDGHDTIEWIASRPWSNGRTGMVGSSYAGITQIRTALERPPHLTAIWPDVAPTNTYHHQTREGGAMQLHMFWALYIHAADAQEVQGDSAKQEEVWDDLRNLRHEIVEHLKLRFPKGEAARRYNVLQKLAYFTVIFILGPLVVLTGLTMSPTMDAAFPWLPWIFGGRQTARTIHFICAFSFVAFFIIHIVMVFLSGTWNGIRSMITGRYSIDSEAPHG